MITIDYQSKLPLYEQIAERFQALILRGALPPGSQMPSVRSLAVELSINPNTIQKAFALLEQQGYIYPVRGRGNYVSDTAKLAENKKHSLLEEIRQLLRQGKELGITRSEYITVLDGLYQEEDIR
ncbi:MAG TPA: GntR family transcriptional regulator [Candidatus Mediterraneibacter intestinavium]|jgi:GntR family transcriptional regulator|nr:GntR family transcriptional regulator [Candidatus Mediterraneibacter surreyensis]HJB83049.1 GntR family transcriptional regulator [Candidatus Mediterraneibacter intestinavium]